MKIALIALAGIAASAAAQDTLFLEDFEGANQYTTSTPEFSDGAGDFWFNTASGLSFGTFVNYSGADGEFFAGMDLDGEGASLPLIQTFDSFSIANYENLRLNIDLAEDDDGTAQDWDPSDFVAFEYEIDGSGNWIELNRVAGAGLATFNEEPLLAGTAVTDTFTTFALDLDGVSGSTLAVRAVWQLDAGDEDLAIDNVEVIGTLIPAPGAVALFGAAGLAAARRRR